MDKYLALIRDWARDRGLHEADPTKQTLKLMEETGELASAMVRKDMALVEDAIGDIVVVLTVLSEQLGLSMEDCVGLAYRTIKDRKGRMVDGLFVKESDLN